MKNAVALRKLISGEVSQSYLGQSWGTRAFDTLPKCLAQQEILITKSPMIKLGD